jgi:hypothetical protein
LFTVNDAKEPKITNQKNGQVFTFWLIQLKFTAPMRKYLRHSFRKFCNLLYTQKMSQHIDQKIIKTTQNYFFVRKLDQMYRLCGKLFKICTMVLILLL